MKSPTIPKRYEVRSLLGEGGSGRVYRVQDSIRDRGLALKLVTPAESAFLRREFDTLRQIRHENLIQVFDWGVLPSGEAYYTMELIEGGGATRMGEPQPAEDVRHVLTGLLRGLAHLHCHGEIHGDLKPGNILLGAGGVVKITDAGMGGSGERADGLSGTPGYAAPEVWEGAPADVRSDLYSVGVMAYEALTGRHPFAGRTVREVISGQLEGWVPSPGAHGVRVPADLERVVMRALERQPGLRQGSADEFMEGFGVEDRIGEILGGKLVGREKEIAEIERLLHAEEAGTPTLVDITGEPGIGKTALMEEVAARILGAGGRALEIDLSSAKPIAAQILEFLGVPSQATSSAGPPPELHAQLWEFAKEFPVLLYTGGAPDRATNNAFRGLARYVWALSLEQGRGSHILIALRNGEGPEEPFVRTIHVDPMSEAGCEQVISATLGAANLQSELISKLHALSGGNPGVLRSTLASLIERDLLRRRDGVWAFREAAQIYSLGLESGVNPWVIAWGHLGPEEQRLMSTVSLFRRPIPTPQLEKYTSSQDAGATLSTLLAKGWLRQVRGGWAPSSDGVRQAVQGRGTRESQAQIAASVLKAMPAGDSEERTDLELRYRPSPDVLERGLISAEQAVDRGDQRSAVEKLRLCLGIAHEANQADRTRSISLRIASLLHNLGDEDGAESYLKREEYWGKGNISPADATLRSHLFGQIAMTKGDLDSARTHLLQCIEMAGKAKNTSLFMRCHADLAEMDWRHGDAASRARAIGRVRQVLSQHPEDPSFRDERAALMYQLGAAIVFGGASREAVEILQAGYELAESDYWKMRLANAMSSAFHYLGDVAGELEWLDKAWRYAESSRSDSFRARILSNRGAWFVHQGQFAEAADQNRLSATWARRFGGAFEYAAGRAGSAMCAIYLAKYEDALADAREVRSAAQTLNDYTYVAKAFEIEGLANYFLGRGESAERGVREALSLLDGHGYTVVKPRLEWLLAKVLIRRGEVEESNKLLREAETQLLETRDPEDLWGVQIEMHLRHARNGNARSSLVEIETLFRAAEQRGLLVIAVPAALAISEILHEQGLDHTESWGLLTVGLERAEGSGMRELAWQLSYRMGVLAARAGQAKESHSRFTLASRVLRQIAGELGAENRRSYLRADHVSSAIKDMDSALWRPQLLPAHLFP
jgi:tetratricopeptide (TPR) repeat protein